MKVNLAYGNGWLPIEVPPTRTTVIEPAPQAGLVDEHAAVIQALTHPIASLPLRQLIRPADQICIVITDITRATPNRRLIPWLLEHLAHLPRQNITLLVGLGTHRPNTRPELEEMLTPEIVRDYRVLNHEPENPAALVQLGTTRDGAPALINRGLVEANVRILTGFIEPHFFAGFSGGPKAICPGLAGLPTILSNHGLINIGDPRATYGITEGNPIWEEMRDIALRAGPSFLLNVALNEQRQITGIFAGDMLAAHKVGIEFVRRAAMQPVASKFDIVVTSNSGYPLDLNLYQGVKGMSTAARIIKSGGAIILAAECREGLPANSPMTRLLQSVSCPEQILVRLAAPGFVQVEQWQAQIQALVQRKAEVLLVASTLSDDEVKSVFLTPCHDISAEIERRLAVLGPDACIAVLPQGPLTIPYLAA